jgi:hypothetical protein
MADRPWQRTEHRVAVRLGGRRIPVTVSATAPTSRRRRPDGARWCLDRATGDSTRTA